jgi:hypothetical protein
MTRRGDGLALGAAGAARARPRMLASISVGQVWVAGALTPRVCACVLVAVEMPFSSTFSAAAGGTEVL